MDLLQNLGIHGKLLLAQIVNFIILWWVLKKFVYVPLMKVMEERQRKIEKGIQDAEESKRKLELIKKEEKQVLEKAHKKAQEIVEKAEKQAKKNSEKIVEKTKRQAEQIVQEAKEEIAEEKKKTLQEAKEEIADLVYLAAKKVVNDEVSEKDSQIVEKIITTQKNKIH